VGGAILLLPLYAIVFYEKFYFLPEHTNVIPRATEVRSAKYLPELKTVQNKN
jgi:hypothetical protein